MPNLPIRRAQLKSKRIGVLLGGLSAEREVSLRTGQAVQAALSDQGYTAVAIDAGRDLPAQLCAADVDLAFIALHGRFGEDGTVQGLLEVMQIPYTGSGVLASSLAIDKVMTKQQMLCHGIATPESCVFRQGDDLSLFAAGCHRFPAVVKPAREGSTIGISMVETREQLENGVRQALDYDDLILVEEFIRGDEVTVSVLNGRALPVIKIVPRSGFYDYQSKYTAGQTEYLLPAPLPQGLYRQLQDTAENACRILGCRGAARVDFMVRDNQLFCLEVNTIPGMTATSLLPKAAAAAGIDFSELVMRILEDADLGK